MKSTNLSAFLLLPHLRLPFSSSLLFFRFAPFFFYHQSLVPKSQVFFLFQWVVDHSGYLSTIHWVCKFFFKLFDLISSFIEMWFGLFWKIWCWMAICWCFFIFLFSFIIFEFVFLLFLFKTHLDLNSYDFYFLIFFI